MENKQKTFGLNEFSENFKRTVAKGVFILKFLKKPITGSDWEDIVMRGMKAEKVKGNENLADVKNEVTAWSCKTLGNKNLKKTEYVDLISGRLDVSSEFDLSNNIRKMDPCDLGKHVIELWNKRVFKIGDMYNDIRTIILLRDENVDNVMFYEELAEPYSFDDYKWEWNNHGVLNGISKSSGIRQFAFQPSGTQLRVTSKIPDQRVVIKIGQPNECDYEKLLELSGFKYGENCMELNNIPIQLKFDF